MNVQLMVTVSGNNQVDLIKVLSDKTDALSGQWINSKINHIDDYVAGLIKIEIAEEHVKQLISDFKSVSINVDVVNLEVVTHHKATPLNLSIDGKDRSGLVKNISQVLSENCITVEQMECHRLGVPGVEGTLFTSHFKIVVDEQFNKSNLVAGLQEIAPDLIIDLSA